jgi:hypothetical protein
LAYVWRASKHVWVSSKRHSSLLIPPGW